MPEMPVSSNFASGAAHIPHFLLLFSHFFSIRFPYSLQIAFMAGVDRKEKDDLTCGVVAGFVQYFALATFLWLLVEGYHVYVAIMTWLSASEEAERHWRYYLGFAWIVPLLIVVITAGVAPASYGTEKVCWLDPSSNAILYSFFMPLAIMLCTNLFILVRVVFFIRKDEKLKGKSGKVRRLLGKRSGFSSCGCR